MMQFPALWLSAITLLLPQAASPPGTLGPPSGPPAQTSIRPGSAVHPRNQSGGGSGESHAEHSESITSAQREAWYGEYQLSWARIDEARDHCKAALDADPANKTAIRCLSEAAKMAVDDQLNQADKLLLQNKPADAAVLAALIAHSQVSSTQIARANYILGKALWPKDKAWKALPDWIRPIIDTLLFIAVVTLIVRLLRWLDIKARTRKFLRRKTVWSLLPLRDLPDSTDAERATDGLLDSMARLGEELTRPPWRPRFLLLRPTPPADYEPAVISDFLSTCSQPPILFVPEIPALQTEWNFHEVRLDDAIQNLQLKAAGGIDLGALLRFLMALGKWISASKPTISGTVEISTAVAILPGPGGQPASGSSSAPTSRSVAIHLAARGIQVPTISITTSSDLQPGIDCVQLAAERAAFKFLVRMQYPQMTNDEVNGHAALRQGASLFTEFAATVPDGGPAAATRTSSLKSAARNFAFFRSSIPFQSAAPDPVELVSQSQIAATEVQPPPSPASKLSAKKKKPAAAATIPIPDEIRQGALLAEGVALALTNDPLTRNAAINSFRQLQEWPGSVETELLRQQAAYNEAVVRRSMGFYGQCVLMLTELLGDDIPGTDGRKPAMAQATVVEEKPKDRAAGVVGVTPVETPGQAKPGNPRDFTNASACQIDPTKLPSHPNPNNLPEALLYTARLARLSAFAQYTREEWTILPQERAELLLNDAEALVKDAEVLVNYLEAMEPKPLSCVHDSRMALYMRAQAKRAAGHVELQNACQNAPKGFYDKDHRPNFSIDLDQNVVQKLKISTGWMRDAEAWTPTTGLYCDIAESYLLCRRFVGAQAYARHATLQAAPFTNSPTTDKTPPDPDTERAFYLATESWFLAGDKAMALKYAQRYTVSAELDEFKALRTALGLENQNSPSTVPNTPVASTKAPTGQI